MNRPKNIKMMTGITDDALWEKALNETELMGCWLDWLFSWMPGFKYQLWGARAFAYVKGYMQAVEDDRNIKPQTMKK